MRTWVSRAAKRYRMLVRTLGLQVPAMNNMDFVAVWVAEVRTIVAKAIVRTRPRRAIVGSAIGQASLM